MFSFPPINNIHPIWTGHGFKLGNKTTSILSYSENENGWSDDLTVFHEDTAGTNHFIDLASRAHAISQVANYKESREAVILEAGCSSGFMINDLRQSFPGAFIMGSDAVRGLLERLAKKIPDIPLLHFDLVRCPLFDDSIDVVILLNVLEHIQDDRSALQQVWRVLKPGGIAIIEVPAGPNLFDVYDRLLLHYRRYAQKDLANMILQVGFEIIKSTHLGFFMYPGFALVKKSNQRRMQQMDDQRIVFQNIKETGNNFILKSIISLELVLGKWISYPFGIRCLITVRKP